MKLILTLQNYNFLQIIPQIKIEFLPSTHDFLIKNTRF